MELSIGSTVVLFSDLTGSTALYEQMGDARAFALIEQHFRIAARVGRSATAARCSRRWGTR